MSSNEVIIDGNKKKKGKALKIFLIVIIFLALGIFVGIYGTTKYMEMKEEENNQNDVVEEKGPVDITDDNNYKDLIDSLYKTINGNVMFYSTKGIDMSTIDNSTKLTMIFNYLNSAKQGTEEILTQTYWGSGVCQNNFVLDPVQQNTTTSSGCTVTKFSRDLFVQTSKKLFNDDVLDTSVNFNPSNTKSCIVDMQNNLYICGNIANNNVTGDLESKFTILKVTKDLDGTIKIYEKGYLLDNRSNVKAQHPGYDNIYLHSTDSTEYYYELRNADNLTFVHTFKEKDNQEYYYAGTMLEK